MGSRHNIYIVFLFWAVCERLVAEEKLSEKKHEKKEPPKEHPGVSEQKETIELSLGFLKRHWPIILLVCIVLFGLYLRWYHVDYPVVGYHNWKEVHYLSEARNFARDGFFAHGFFAPAHDYPGLGHDPAGVHSDTFPVISIIVAVLFKIFGESLALARAVGIFSTLASVVVMYLLVKRLFHREELALFSASLMALAPLFVFFSHNVQLNNPGLLFMLLSLYYYVVWWESRSSRHFILMSLWFILAGLTVYSFMIIAIPILLTMPWKEVLDIRKHAKEYAVSFAFLLAFVGWFFYANISLAGKSGGSKVASSALLNLGQAFSLSWWTNLKPYLVDNYTILGFYFSLVGMALFLLFFFLKYRKKALTFGDKFLFSSFVSLLVFILIMSDKMKGHSYHQYPIAPFVLLFIAFGADIVGNTISKAIHRKGITPIIMVLAFLLLLGPSVEAKTRQFNTQFVGLDIAGEFIKGHSKPGELIIHSGHQDYGVIWHADRKGLDGGIPPVADIQRAENEMNARWIFMYQWGLQILNDPVTIGYIQQNYRLRQAAFQRSAQGMNILYLVLEKGGSFDYGALNTLVEGKPFETRAYEYTSGTAEVVYINFDEE